MGKPYGMSLLSWFRSRRSLVRRVSYLRHELRLQQLEIDGLKRQLVAATDFIDKLSWEARAAGAKAKALTESLRKREETA